MLLTKKLCVILKLKKYNMDVNKEVIQGVAKAEKYKENPFANGVFNIEKGKKSVIAGSTKQVLVDIDTGQIEGITLMHKYKEVDKEQFVKLYIDEVASLFELSRTGLRVFGFVLKALRINSAEIYIDISELMVFCGYKQKNQVYKGLAELIANKIIAMSVRPNLWFINPSIIFNGDRVVFAKEYRIKDTTKKVKQLNAFDGKEIHDNSESK